MFIARVGICAEIKGTTACYVLMIDVIFETQTNLHQLMLQKKTLIKLFKPEAGISLSICIIKN